MDSKEVEQKKQLSNLKNITGSGTELVSLYIAHDDNISEYKNRIKNEISEADNIKSKSTRKNVKSALKSILQVLQNYRQTPENGLIIFSSKENTFVFNNLKEPVVSSRYKCDSSFYVQPLEDLLLNKRSYGLLVITENQATIGELAGNRVKKKKSIESNLHGKHKAGGQSAQRFSRDRKQKKKKYFKKVGKNLKNILDNVEGVLIGGVNITVKSFKRGDYIPHNIDVIGQFNVDHAGKSGLRELAEKSKEVISEKELNKEREKLEEFYKSLRKGKDAYGKEAVEKYINHGRVDTLLLSDQNKETHLAEKTEQMGGEVLYISTDFEKGEQFHKNFNGIGAILRW